MAVTKLLRQVTDHAKNKKCRRGTVAVTDHANTKKMPREMKLFYVRKGTYD